MRFLLFFSTAVLLLLPFAGLKAQETAPQQQQTDATAAPEVMPVYPDGEVTAEPICFNVVNGAPYTVFGTFVTNIYTGENGVKARHRSNFRLETGFKTEFCTTGPFYEGRKLELVIRTLIPVFSCKTALTGDIVIHGRKKPEGGTETWADCL